MLDRKKLNFPKKNETKLGWFVVNTGNNITICYAILFKYYFQCLASKCAVVSSDGIQSQNAYLV